MNFRLILQLILIGLIAWFGTPYLQWWGIIPLAAVIGFLVNSKGWVAWLAGFLGVFIVWLIQIWLASAANDHLLANKTGALIGGLSGISLILISATFGGLLAGLGTLTGQSFRRMLKKPATKAEQSAAA